MVLGECNYVIIMIMRCKLIMMSGLGAKSQERIGKVQQDSFILIIMR